MAQRFDENFDHFDSFVDNKLFRFSFKSEVRTTAYTEVIPS